MLRVSALSDIGLIRKQNEDSVQIIENKMGHYLLLVADGMGGHNAGEVASEMASKIVADMFSDLKEPVNYLKFIQSVTSKANHEIYKAALLNEKYSKMGTTLTFLIYDNEKIYTGHVGDSRIYFVGKESITQITKDHTIVQEMIDNNNMTEEEAKTSKLKNVLVQALGTSKKMYVEAKAIKPPLRFKLLLCSDGLTSFVSDEEIKEIINLEITIDEKLANLVELAKIKDGSDNISVVLMEEV